jgi:PIN domain nuclease of toxin-antitoxin system
MNLLLDTHIWIWSVLEPQKLSARVTKQLTSPENQLWLSAISVWEALSLHRKRRLELDEEAESWVRRTLDLLQLNEAPLTIDVAVEVSKLKLTHGDPADRFLVATAKVFGLTLVTSDERIIDSADVPVLSNR